MGMHYLPTNLDLKAGALDDAKAAYVRGKITVAELEEAVEKILDGTDKRYTSSFGLFAVEGHR